MKLRRSFCAALALAVAVPLLQAKPAIRHDTANKRVTLSDGRSQLVLRVSYDGRCVVDEVFVRGRQVVSGDTGAASGICVSNQWFTTRSNIATPHATVKKNTVTLSGIHFGNNTARVEETWTFTVLDDGIDWRIDREYRSPGWVDDTRFPGWEFPAMTTWTGALLGNGGVAWNTYLDTPNATFSTRADSLTFWNREQRDCLRIVAELAPGGQMALKFSRQPDGKHRFAHIVSRDELQPKHHLRRFHPSRQDIWRPFEIAPGKTTVRFTLQALSYDEAYARGTFRGLNGDSIRELLNTIGRYGVIDRAIIGANGWRTGWTCLHEPWFAQIGMALNDPGYVANFTATLDHERDFAIGPDGRVKARWHHDAGDAMPGTYDAHGYYEAQWGWLLDSQPCFVICVAEQFDLTGDLEWLRSHKESCERALDYLLRRDSDGDGLVEMINELHSDQRGSDWIDIIWAAHENALVNAELYGALQLWADAEELLGDDARARHYRSFAARLKASFNKSIAEGGFWDPANEWYVYWRDKDDSIHGNNLVTPVQFTAIAYGVCDDPARRAAILRRMEIQMQKENLFFWPLNFFPYEPDEGHANNFPYPKYENGDIFLPWGELAVRAYAAFDPAIAVQYIRSVLDKYESDGLSFQRYARQSQGGLGDDILAGNCTTVVGLYRNVYGIQPKHNRLWLEPQLTPELHGTQLRYALRNQDYVIDLEATEHRVAVGGFVVRGRGAFGVNARGNMIEFFSQNRTATSMAVTRAGDVPVEVQIHSWPAHGPGVRRWTSVTQSRATLTYVLLDLPPNVAGELKVNGTTLKPVRADGDGRVEFKHRHSSSKPQLFELTFHEY